MLDRSHHLRAIGDKLRHFPVVAIVGARQVGKTTLARVLAAQHAAAHIFDLEDEVDRRRLGDARLTLAACEGLVVLDEVQHAPEVFQVLRVLVDRPENRARFLVLGSASPALLRQSAESLAGRIAYHELDGFDLSEVGVEHYRRLWLRGGFPLSYLAESAERSADWRRAFMRTFVERDLPQLGVRIAATTMMRLWTMLAHSHGQVLNIAKLARALGVSNKTVAHYIDVLVDAFMIRRLLPWFENLKKRQVKSPKIYLRDTGILHALLNLSTPEDVFGHPAVGSSWEGFALEAVRSRLRARPEECTFWSTHAGAELDLFVVRGNRRFGFEFKRCAAPATTRSMHVALADLRLERLDVVYPGEHTFVLGERMRALPLAHLERDLDPL